MSCTRGSIRKPKAEKPTPVHGWELITMVQRAFTVRLRKDEESGYYAARCVELPKAISQGRTEEEALANVREAIELVLEEYGSQAKEKTISPNRVDVVCPQNLTVVGTDHLKASGHSYFASR